MTSPRRRSVRKTPQARPCDGCAWLKHCRAHGTACRAFQHWVDGESWTDEERINPTTRLADAIDLHERKVL